MSLKLLFQNKKIHLGYDMIHGKKRYFQDAPSAIGPEFSDDDIERTLIRRKISYSTPDNMAGKVAELLADGEIVSVFNAKMEFGERALGLQNEGRGRSSFDRCSTCASLG